MTNLNHQISEAERIGDSSYIRLANESQKIAIIDSFSVPVGQDMSLEQYRERGHYIRQNCAVYRERLLQWSVPFIKLISVTGGHVR